MYFPIEPRSLFIPCRGGFAHPAEGLGVAVEDVRAALLFFDISVYQFLHRVPVKGRVIVKKQAVV
jgi:hypothetical protein